MPIERGEAWGQTGGLPDDGVVVHSDAEARAIVEEARRAGRTPPVLGLLDGDLCRTLGGRGDEGRLRDPASPRLPVDLGAVMVDGRLHWFVAHLVARRSWWTGRLFAAMNAQFIGSWDVAPRSHPNDGRLDTLDVTMGLADRWRARTRVLSGSHVPHPRIAEAHPKAVQVDLEPPAGVWLDGVKVTDAAKSLSIRVEPDALICVV